MVEYFDAIAPEELDCDERRRRVCTYMKRASRASIPGLYMPLYTGLVVNIHAPCFSQDSGVGEEHCNDQKKCFSNILSWRMLWTRTYLCMEHLKGARHRTLWFYLGKETTLVWQMNEGGCPADQRKASTSVSMSRRNGISINKRASAWRPMSIHLKHQ